MTLRLWMKSSIIAVAGAFILALPAAADVTAVSGNAFGLQATGPVGLLAVPSVTLPASGSGGVPITAFVLSGSVNGIATTGAMTVSTRGATGPTGFAESTSEVLNLNLFGVPGQVLTADAVRSQCRSDSSGSTGSTTLVNARLNGVVVNSSPPPNFVLLNVLGITIILNEQTVSGGTGTSSIDVNAIHVSFGTVAQREDIIIAHSHCDVSSPTAVKLQTFSAAPAKAGVTLRWKTASELQTAGFNLYRQQGAKLVKVNATLIAARGSAALGHSYTLVDRHAPRSPVVRYRLQEVQRDGSRIWLARTSLAG